MIRLSTSFNPDGVFDFLMNAVKHSISRINLASAATKGCLWMGKGIGELNSSCNNKNAGAFSPAFIVVLEVKLLNLELKQ